MKICKKGIILVIISLFLVVNIIPTLTGNIQTNEENTKNYGCWVTETLDSINNVGRFTSIDLDSNDYPHISYYNDSNGDLKYARWTGSEWIIETVDSIDDVGVATSIDLDSNDYPHISYYNKTGGDLKYARWTGSEWIIETVDFNGIVGQETSIKLDSNDYPHISYYDLTNTGLKYAKWTGSDWFIDPVDDIDDIGRSPSIDLDSNDYPHISFIDATNYKAKYTRWTGTDWAFATIGSIGNYFGGDLSTSIVVDSNNHPHIAYTHWTQSDLMYATHTGSEWIVDTVDWINKPGRYPSITVDSNDYPHISHYEADYNDLKYSKWTGTDWSTEVVDTTGGVGHFTSIELDSTGAPHISYHHTDSYDLKYARRINAACINTRTNEEFCTIQDGIDDSDTITGDTIKVYSGNYYENLVIDKSINLIGEDKDTTIVGNYGNDAILIQDISNVQIKNLTISNSNFGIHYTTTIHSENINIENCIISSNANSGIYFDVTNDVDNILISECNLSNNGQNGLDFYCHGGYISSSKIDNCTMTFNTLDGININVYTVGDDFSGNVIENCTMNNNGRDGIYLINHYSAFITNNIFKDLTIYDNNYYGIRFNGYYVYGNSFKNINIYGNTDYEIYFFAIDWCYQEFNQVYTNGELFIYRSFEHPSSIKNNEYTIIEDLDLTMNVDSSNFGKFILYDCSYFIIRNITISNSDFTGIYMHKVNFSNLSYNILTDNHYGIWCKSCENVTIDHNNVSSNDHLGIGLENSHNNNIINNYFNTRDLGIYLWKSYTNKIESNTIVENEFGIVLEHQSQNNTISNNSIIQNDYGIEISNSYNNIIFNNYFDNENNYNNTYYNNIWNVSKTPGINIIGGPYLGGNFWSDYEGTDDDGDGLGDTNLPYGPGDYLPLTAFININQSVFNRGFPIRHAADGDWAAAQNFTSTVNTLTKCEIYLRKFGNPEFDLTVELRTDHPQGTIIDTLVFIPEELLSSWQWLELDFDDIAVDPSDNLFIVCPPAPGGVSTSFGYEWGYAFGDQYQPGSFWFTRDGGDLWRDLPNNYEFVFRTFGYD